MELRELGTVRVAVAGRVTEDDGIPVQLAPAAQTVVTVGVVAAPFAVVPVLVLLQVVSVVLRLHNGVVHLGTGHIQPRHGVGVFLSCVLQLLLPVHGGDDLAGGLWLAHFGYAGIFLFLMASGGTDRRPHQHNGDEGAKQKSSDLFHSVFSCRVGRRHGSWVVNGVQSFLWRKRNSAEAGAIDRPPRCPLLFGGADDSVGVYPASARCG